MNTFNDAVAYATEKHQGQYRKNGNRPYICHPLEVVATLRSYRYNNDVLLTAAILHDVIEDCGVSFADLKSRYGETVAQIVSDCSNPVGDNELSREERNRINHEHIAKSQHYATFLIKAADRLCNLRDMDWYQNRKWYRSYLERTRSYLLPVLSKHIYQSELYKDLEREVYRGFLLLENQ